MHLEAPVALFGPMSCESRNTAHPDIKAIESQGAAEAGLEFDTQGVLFMPESKKSVTLEKDRKEAFFPIVAIGASAGGLEALEGFFDNMPSETHTAFVAIQHLSPEGKSMLGDILKKHTRMKILSR